MILSQVLFHIEVRARTPFFEIVFKVEFCSFLLCEYPASRVSFDLPISRKIEGDFVRGENDWKQSDEFQASGRSNLTSFRPLYLFSFSFNICELYRENLLSLV